MSRVRVRAELAWARSDLEVVGRARRLAARRFVEACAAYIETFAKRKAGA